jgi:hypothetical protein
MARELEPWGGEVGMPVLRRGNAPADTPERAHERRQPQDGPSVLENADRAAVGPLTDLYREGKERRRR